MSIISLKNIAINVIVITNALKQLTSSLMYDYFATSQEFRRFINIINIILSLMFINLVLFICIRIYIQP